MTTSTTRHPLWLRDVAALLLVCGVAWGVYALRSAGTPTDQEHHMASANVKEFTDANFQQEVLSSDQPVLVDFWAEWCAPCRALGPTIEKVADKFAGKAKVGKMNTDHAQQTAVKYGINAIPTVILFNKGQVVQKFVGVQQEAAYSGAIEAASK